MIRQPDVALVVFAKVPGLGTAKSRIARDCGELRADGIYRELLAATARIVSGVRYYLAFTGGERPEELKTYFADAAGVVEQHGDTLGQRMANAARFVFDKGHSHACIVGCDIPSLTSAIIDRARAWAPSCDAVIGPAADGGYYLVQIGPRCIDLFSVQGWGTASLLHETVSLAARRGWSCRLLDTLSDIDTYDDYRVWKGNLP